MGHWPVGRVAIDGTASSLDTQEGVVARAEAVQRVLEGASLLGVPAPELYIADEVFFTGTAAEITPVREIDNRVVGEGTRGPITTKIQTKFFDIVRGSDNSHPAWLTRV